MTKKLFTLAPLNARSFLKRMATELAKVQLDFSLRWTQGRPVALKALWTRPKGGEWINRLEKPLGDNDGEITVAIGGYVSGDEIEVHFEAFALAPVPKMAAFVVEDEQRVQKLAPLPPDDEFVSLESGKAWQPTAKYSIVGTKSEGGQK